MRSLLLYSLFLLLGGSALLFSGCGSSSPTPPPTGSDVTLRLFDGAWSMTPTSAAWVAFQDGDGAWQRIDPVTEGVYVAEVTDAQGRYAFAARTTSYTTVFMYATLSELTEVTQFLNFGFAFTRAPRDVNANPGTREGSYTMYGALSSEVFSLSSVIARMWDSGVAGGLSMYGVSAPPGLRDLVIALPYGSPTHIFFDRDVNLQGDVQRDIVLTEENTSALESGNTADFTALPTDSNCFVWYYTRNNTSMPLADPVGGSTVPYGSVPAAARVAGDVYGFDVHAYTGSDNYNRTLFLANPGDVTVLTPPAPFTSVAGALVPVGGVALPEFTGLNYPDTQLYHLWLTANQPGLGWNGVRAICTAGWLQASGASTWRAPDLSGVENWNSSWSFPASVTAGYWTGEAIAGNLTPALAQRCFISWLTPVMPDGTEVSRVTRTSSGID